MPGRSYRPATPDEQAFAYALNEMREKDCERAAKKLPELADFFSARENLVLAKTMVKSKRCRLSNECARNLEIFLEAPEKEIQQKPSLVSIAYASVTKMVSQMVAEAKAAGSSRLARRHFSPQSRRCSLEKHHKADLPA